MNRNPSCWRFLWRFTIVIFPIYNNRAQFWLFLGLFERCLEVDGDLVSSGKACIPAFWSNPEFISRLSVNYCIVYLHFINRFVKDHVHLPVLHQGILLAPLDPDGP